VGIVHRRHKPLTPTAARFVEMLQEPSDAAPAAARPRARSGAAVSG
jgi:hypothetical protein